MNPARIRNASHLVAHISKMLRQKGAPSQKDWDYLRSLFGGDEAFEVSNELIDLAQKIERKNAEKAA